MEMDIYHRFPPQFWQWRSLWLCIKTFWGLHSIHWCQSSSSYFVLWFFFVRKQPPSRKNNARPYSRYTITICHILVSLLNHLKTICMTCQMYLKEIHSVKWCWNELLFFGCLHQTSVVRYYIFSPSIVAQMEHFLIAARELSLGVRKCRFYERKKYVWMNTSLCSRGWGGGKGSTSWIFKKNN